MASRACCEVGVVGADPFMREVAWLLSALDTMCTFWTQGLTQNSLHFIRSSVQCGTAVQTSASQLLMQGQLSAAACRKWQPAAEWCTCAWWVIR